MNAAIETKGLTKLFGGRKGVDHLDLTVPAGTVFALLGDNGAGKSTTIKLLTGLIPPDSGFALVLGRDAWKSAADLRHKVGYVPERPKFYDWMTVDQIGWFTAGFHEPGFLTSYQERVARFRLDSKAKLSNLSKGEYAKVGLALALAPDPEVLILDEPTSGLDLLVRREFLGSIVDLAAEGRTILISSHQIAEVERIATHVAFLSHGKLLLSAPVEELRERIVRYRFRFEGESPDPATLGTVLERNGSGKLWHAVVRDPDFQAVAGLRAAPHISDFEATPLTLEETYCSLLGGKEGRA